MSALIVSQFQSYVFSIIYFLYMKPQPYFSHIHTSQPSITQHLHGVTEPFRKPAWMVVLDKTLGCIVGNSIMQLVSFSSQSNSDHSVIRKQIERPSALLGCTAQPV